MTRFRATLAYDGTGYQGFQRQQNGIRTVQGAIERAVNDITGNAVSVVAAGRTDTGVHATGQVIAFDVIWSHEDDDLLRAINARLPVDIALQDIRQQEGFHPRFDAQSRSYCYQVMVTAQRDPMFWNRMWQVQQPLKLEAMQAAADELLGTHDFAAFGKPPQGNNTVREVLRSEWAQDGAVYSYDIEATAFLHRMVRRIVGNLVDVGRGWISVEAFAAVLESRDISQAKTMAPPQGLVLKCVNYSEESAGRRTEGQNEHETEDICNNTIRH